MRYNDFNGKPEIVKSLCRKVLIKGLRVDNDEALPPTAPSAVPSAVPSAGMLHRYMSR